MPNIRFAAFAALTSLAGCQAILDLEEARLDPSLTTKPDETIEADETTEPAAAVSTSESAVAPDAGSSDVASSAPGAQCEEAFDNARVKLLRADGTLPPLPEAPAPAN